VPGILQLVALALNFCRRGDIFSCNLDNYTEAVVGGGGYLLYRIVAIRDEVQDNASLGFRRGVKSCAYAFYVPAVGLNSAFDGFARLCIVEITHDPWVVVHHPENYRVV